MSNLNDNLEERSEDNVKRKERSLLATACNIFVLPIIGGAITYGLIYSTTHNIITSLGFGAGAFMFWGCIGMECEDEIDRYYDEYGKEPGELF